MKKAALILLALVFAFSLAACGSNNNEGNNNNGAASAPSESPEATEAPVEPVTLKIGATAEPHAKILEQVKPLLEEQGIELEIVEFTDYVQPNVQVYEKELDANFFQHIPYLEQFNADQNMDLVSVVGVHIEPFGAYSSKLTSVDELKDGATVAIPNDPTNGGRALALLASNGLLTLKEGVGVAGTVADIVDNPKNLKIEELEAAMLPRVLQDVDMALINTNYALEAELNPTEDALFIEGSDSPYVNIIAARPDNKDSEAIQALAEAVTSPEVKQFIEETYAGAVVPAFE